MQLFLVVIGGHSAQGRRERRFNVVEVISLRRHAQVVCVDEAASVGVYVLVVGVDVEQHRCCTLPCGSPFRCRPHRLFFPSSTTEKRLLSGMVRIRSVSCTSPVISTAPC